MDIEISKDPFLKRLFWTLISFELALVFFDLLFNSFRVTSIKSVRRMFNLAREDSFPSWFSSTQLIVVGLVVLLVAYVIYQQVGKGRRFYCWAAIGSFFTFMGVDDAIKFHERMGTIFRVLSERNDEGASSQLLEIFPSYPWQLVLGPFFIAMGFFIMWFLWKELKENSLRLLVFVALSCYALAMGLDFVEGMDIDLYNNLARTFNTKAYHVSHIFKVTEEYLEILGTTFFLIVFLKYLLSLSSNWKISIR